VVKGVAMLDLKDFYLENYGRELGELHKIVHPTGLATFFYRNKKNVRFLQELIWLTGIRGIVIDGMIGPQTRGFVSEIIQRFGLGEEATPYHVVFALYAKYLDAFAYLPAGGLIGNSDCSSALAVALYYEGAGAREIPPNTGPWARRFMQGNEGADFPWCTGFVSHCILQSNNFVSLPEMLPYTVSTDQLAESAKTRKVFIEGSSLKGWKKVTPGVIFLVRGKAEGDWIHSGFVKQVLRVGKAAFSFETVEGNTSEKGGREGVDIRVRARVAYGTGYDKTCYDFVYPIASDENVRICAG